MANVFRTVIRIITCIALFICPMPTEKKCEAEFNGTFIPVSYTHLRAHET